jgi:small-conductance mechanosensitive channel
MKKTMFAVLIVLLSIVAPRMNAQSTAPAGATAPPAPTARIEVGGETVFVLHAGVGSFTPQERADAANERLRRLVKEEREPIKLEVKQIDLQWHLTAGDQSILAVTDQDARAEGKPAEGLAYQWEELLQERINRAQARTTRLTLVKRGLITALVISVAVVLLWLLRGAHRRLKRELETRRWHLPTWRFRGLEVVRAETLFGALKRGLLIAYLVSAVVLAFGALLLVFAQFPATRGYAAKVGFWLWKPLVDITRGAVGYLPNLFYILVILLVTRVALRALSFVFKQAERGVISLEPWVQPDVAKPTGQIIKLLVVLISLFFIAPLVPGTGSTAAKGISVIVGLMISFGSTSTVGNVIAGVVLTYMRPFRLGDRVKVGEVQGDVLERTFLYTKVLTIKNEEVIVPSLQALGNAIVNYSARAKEAGLILHTTVTIGYDAPWRKVHELLLRAAERTGDVLKDPKPFILQTALNDFFVSYQLNVYTDQACKQANIYGELHENIQDSFAESGIEILSPHYYQLRDGNTTTVPREHWPADYSAQRFRVDARVAEAGR